ncbi:hypothetical protein SNOG_07330 [Parastagonospora nodorum SN15]|jgi:hypothetical protein|nr:hypothetical protein SNOG_07330 [Parastagonospora nodorum SN15]EAT84796.2 hypothetical protein SNOG_07330 [Parastagonospora nodorum SN15]
MRASTILAAFALAPSVLSMPSHLYRRCDNETGTENGTAEPPVPALPVCNLAGLKQPDSVLQPPTADMKLMMVALGEGTQNYTCGANLTAPPSAIGAVATLFDASCDLVNSPPISTQQLGSIEEDAKSIGAHFFVDNTTPDFDILGLGNTRAKKTEECAAPNPTGDVKWLRLTAQADGSTSAVKEIYRLNTVGGLAPKSCEGKAVGDIVTVEYQAQYWIYA